MEAERVLIVEVDKCTGCGICELTCSMAKHGEYNPEKSSVRVLANKETYVHVPALDMNCDLCGQCAKACPTNALSIVKLEAALAMVKDRKTGSLPLPRFRGARN